jgi:hypothetical protein
MHPYLILELARERTADRHEAARRAGLRRALRKAARAQRGHVAPDVAVDLPPIPDYVDGTFREAEDAATADRAGAAR